MEGAKKDAMRYLAAKARSEAEMRRYLSKREWPDDMIDDTVDWLYHYEYLDDEAYAGAFIRDKLRFHPCGRLKIRYDLLGRGVDEHFIDRAMARNYPETLEMRLARHFYKKTVERGRSREQALRYLHQKGFSGAAIQAVEAD